MTENEGDSTDNPTELLEEARNLIEIRGGGGLKQAVEKADEAIACIEKTSFEGERERKRSLASASILKAEALRDQGTAETRAAAFIAYGKVLEELIDVQDLETVDRDLLANAWTNRGMILLQESASERLREAVECFDEAIAQRNQMPLEENVLYSWGMVGSWMNRGDALTRIGGGRELQEAVNSYDEALNHMKMMPLKEHPAYLSRVALAWLNRGRSLEAQKERSAVTLARDSFNEAVNVMRQSASPDHPEHRRILAFALVNRGHSLLIVEKESPEKALNDAREALGLTTEIERHDIMAAQAGIWSRHLLCLGLVQVYDPQSKGVRTREWLSEATDAVDEGMELTRLWNQRGVDLSDLVARLFRVGGYLYQVYQPQFLREFLQESLDPAISPGAPVHRLELHQIAVSSTKHTLEQIDRVLPAETDAHRRQRLADIREDMLELRERLNEIAPVMV